MTGSICLEQRIQGSGFSVLNNLQDLAWQSWKSIGRVTMQRPIVYAAKGQTGAKRNELEY